MKDKQSSDKIESLVDAFNQKYGLSMPSGSIASYALGIQKMG